MVYTVIKGETGQEMLTIREDEGRTRQQAQK